MEKKYKYFTFELYPDSSDYDCKKNISYIEKNYMCKYILHDKDKNDKGELKKAHYHVVFLVPCPRTLTSIKEELLDKCNVKYAEVVRSQKAILDYLIHKNTPEKYQYSVNELRGDLVLDVAMTEDEIALTLISYIDDQKYISVRSFAKHCAACGMWSVFRRNANVFLSIINEHNVSRETFRKEMKG